MKTSCGKIEHSSAEIVEILAKSFSENTSTSKLPLQFTSQQCTGNYNFDTGMSHETYNAPFTMQELKRAIKHTKNSAPGPDLVHIQMLKNMDYENLTQVLKLYNNIWKTHCIPNSWKEAIVVPILKPGKTPQEPNNYRPIALTSVLCKTMEKMVTQRLMNYLEANNKVDPNQSGFRKNHSTIDQLIKLQQEILDGFTQKQYIVCVFFDFEKAFDRISKKPIMKALQALNLNGNLPLFAEDFLQNRTFKVRLNGYLSTSHVQEIGTPQGAVISPPLFLATLFDIQAQIKKPVCYSLFADDLAMYIRSSSLAYIEKILQKTINELEKWASSKGLQFSPDKTKLINFHRKQNSPPPINITLYGQQIQNVTTHKFLGLHFDQQLTWKIHLQHTKKKSTISLNLLKKISGTKWGADRKSMLRIYSSHVQSIFDYGAIIYSTASKTDLNKLNSVQNQAL
ncbi:unnamed protein product [Allacma fusca]|uniref:Reverse transcriptase domain-containing protein n=1 Tax=Allacma fusca TaxID=39272 RepID=A0A8J2JZH9_9HEXA|nr:unnamed protein product [Allacma fusca]